jgi:hypothetical protein
MAGIVYGQMHHRLSAQGVNFVPSDPGGSIDQSYLAGYVDANADGIDDDSRNNQEFSPVGEWRAETQWDISDWLTFRAGYTGFVIDGFSYASPKMVYVLPAFALSDRSSAETVFSHAITFGIDINR